MNKKSIVGIVIAIIVIIIIVLAVQKSGTKTFKVGVIDVLSGPKAVLGTNSKKGIELALNNFKAAHPNEKVEAIIEDGALDATTSLKAYQKLINTDHVDALIVAASPAINAIYPQASKLQIPVVSYGAEASEDAKDNVFHIFPSAFPVEIALGTVAHTFAGTSTKSVVGVYTNDPAIASLYGAFQSGFGSDIDEFNIEPNATSKDIQTVATKVLAAKPKYIFMTNYSNLGADFIKEVKILTKGKTQPTYIFDPTFTSVVDQYAKALGDLKSLDGSFVVSLEKPDPAAFIAEYKKAYNNEEPGQLSDFGYDAMNLLLQNRTVGAIQKATMTGATGNISFDAVGRRIPAFSVGTIKDGIVPAYTK